MNPKTVSYLTFYDCSEIASFVMSSISHIHQFGFLCDTLKSFLATIIL